MALLIQPARALDFLEAFDDSGARPSVTSRRHLALLARQIAEGPAASLRTTAGDLALILGLWPMPDHLEAWFATGPALRPHLRGALGWARTFMADRGPLRMYTAPDRVAAARLARMCGFEAAGEIVSAIGPLTVWRRDA